MTTEEQRQQRDALASLTAPQEPRGRTLREQAQDRANLEHLWADIQALMLR